MTQFEREVVAACGKIIGADAANAIAAEQSVHWCVVAAMCAAKKSDDPDALATINKWRAFRDNARAALTAKTEGE